MSDTKNNSIVVKDTRFGDLTVAPDALIDFPQGLIGFPRCKQFIMIEHKAPFSWLQSVDEPALAFVVIDGFELGQQLDLKPPLGDKDCDFKEDDEFAILVICTVRPDPTQTTANLKAPLFVNVRNRKGTQVIFDDPRYSTRHPLWADKGSENDKEKENKEE